MTSPDPETVELTDGMRAALMCLPVWGYPPGHNVWPAIEYAATDDPDQFVCLGTDMDAVLRAGLAAVGEPAGEGGVEFSEADALWRVEPTENGLAIQRLLRERGMGEAATSFEHGEGL
jgi:hypothetical protein